MKALKPAMLLAVTLFIILKTQGQQNKKINANLNDPAKFYGRWEGNITTPVLGKQDAIIIKISRGKNRQAVTLEIDFNKKSWKQEVTVKNGCIRVPFQSPKVFGNSLCEGQLSISLMTETDMVGAYETDALDCAHFDLLVKKTAAQ